MQSLLEAGDHDGHLPLQPLVLQQTVESPGIVRFPHHADLGAGQKVLQ